MKGLAELIIPFGGEDDSVDRLPEDLASDDDETHPPQFTESPGDEWGDTAEDLEEDDENDLPDEDDEDEDD